MTDTTPANPAADRLGYTLYAVYRRPELVVGGADVFSGRRSLVAIADRAKEIEALGVTLRGVYDVSGLRADADVMFWLTGDDPAALQPAVRLVRNSREIAPLPPEWTAPGVHREAECAKDQSPAHMRGLTPT